MNVKEIKGYCRGVGLSVREVEQRGTVLILSREKGTELPEVENLRALSAELSEKVSGIRYVTLRLEDFDGQ